MKSEAKVSVRIDYAGAERLSAASVNAGVRAALNEADRILVDLLSQPGQGETYDTYFFTDSNGTVRPGRKRKQAHRASAPGDPPAVDTGDLRRNRSQEVYSLGGSSAMGVLSLNMEYAEALELGTEKIAPRPSIGRIPLENGAELKEAFRKGAKIL